MYKVILFVIFLFIICRSERSLLYKVTKDIKKRLLHVKFISFNNKCLNLKYIP